MSVFYDVLMEKSAQRQEREEQQQGLSLGQKAGVGAAGLAGGVLAPMGAYQIGAVKDYVENRKGNAKILERAQELGKKGDMEGARALGRKALDDSFGRARKVNYGSRALGALAVGYGAKKLFDRYNANKQNQGSAT